MTAKPFKNAFGVFAPLSKVSYPPLITNVTEAWDTLLKVVHHAPGGIRKRKENENKTGVYR